MKFHLSISSANWKRNSLSMHTTHLDLNKKREYFIKRLKFRGLIKAPQFVGSFVFCVLLGFFALFFLVGTIAVFFQSLLYNVIINKWVYIVNNILPFLILIPLRGL